MMVTYGRHIRPTVYFFCKVKKMGESDGVYKVVFVLTNLF